jgi:hypothetical protein
MPEALKGDRCARLANDVVRQKKAIWVGPLTALLLGLACAPASAAPVSVIDPDAHYPESPLWRDGKPLFVEYALSNIKSRDGRHARRDCLTDHCGANSLTPFDGHLLIGGYDDNSLLGLDANGIGAFEQWKPPLPGAVHRWKR